MLIDAQTLPPGTVVTADLGIIGAGPAGLTVARELSGTGLQIVVVESGGIEADPATQALAAGEISGGIYRPPLDHARERRFGGTSNQWDTRWNPMQAGFRGAPLDPIDFAERDWVLHSGWPFDREHLDPWYARAHVAAGMGPYQYEAERWETPGAPRLPLDESVLETSVWHFGAQQAFLVERRNEMERARDVTVLLRANVVALETAADGRHVTAVRAVCLPDKPLTVRARAWVVAAGGIENARLLLLSGIGNGHDLVGRYFMEHQIVRMGYLRPADPSIMERLALYDEREVDGHQVMGKLKFTGDTMRRERLLHMAAAFVPVHRHFRRHRWSASNAAAKLARGIRRGSLPERPLELVKEVLRGWDFVAARTIRRLSGGRLFRYWDEGPSFVRGGGWSALPDKIRRWGALDVQVHAEQAPHPDNRVTLAAERDQLGCPRAHLHFEWRPADIESMRRTQQLLRDEFARSGIGLMEIEEVHGHPPLIHPGLHHHMGTTRMHADPCRGVVDEHCRVHGMENLYLAGCSVFPTGGYINPTLTIMALAIRLADRLKSSKSLVESAPALEG